MQIERLKEQLVEMTADLQVKDKQLRNLRFKSLFDSPKRQEDAESLHTLSERSEKVSRNGSDRKSEIADIAVEPVSIPPEPVRQEADLSVAKVSRNSLMKQVTQIESRTLRKYTAE
jgi:hypothetical protein